jgi:hypothetical protein
MQEIRIDSLHVAPPELVSGNKRRVSGHAPFAFSGGGAGGGEKTTIFFSSTHQNHPQKILSLNFNTAISTVDLPGAQTSI